MNILQEAREIVRTQPMDLRVGHLKVCADELHEAYAALRLSLTRETAVEFNARLSRCLLAIDIVHANEPTPSQGGAMPVPEKQAAVL